MEFTGKHHQLIEPENKPPMDQEKHHALTASKKPEKRSRIRKLFRRCQKDCSKNDIYRKAAQTQIADAVESPFASNNHPQQSNFRRIRRGRRKVLIRRANRVPSWGTTGNVFICVEKTKNKEWVRKIVDKGTAWNTSAKFFDRFDEESAVFLKNDAVGAASADAPSDTQQEGTRISSGQLEIESSYRIGEFQNGNADVDIQDGFEEGFHIIPGLRRCIHVDTDPQDVQEVSSTLVERQILAVPRAAVWIFTQFPYFYQELKKTTLFTEILDGHSYSNRAYNPESEILDGEINQMDWKKYKGGGSRVKNLFSDMESAGGIDAHQFQGVTDDIIRTTSPREAGSLIHLAPGYLGSRDQLAVVQLEWQEEPILLLAMELNLASGSEGQMGTTENNTDCFSMEIRNMVPRPDEIINIPTTSASGDNNNS
ncbi:hypothetical protein AYI70_g4962 [Smittium culicis]|uniref:Uncharacterized protein n=1 Tax=Smittium culicis TaxID=133412 RepID=A0A1R1XWX6_9FUNG|nr:hypothetical protein AYI70_g4962 [Smittium culicis]